MASAKATIDHDEIRKWVETRGGHPAHVKRTGTRRGNPGVLRIDYPGFSGEESLERIDWDQWFEWFDRDNLAFLYQDEKKSRFSKLVDRSTVEVAAAPRSRKHAAPKKTTAAAAKKSNGDGRAKTTAAKKTAATKNTTTAAKKTTAARKTSSTPNTSAAKRTTSHSVIQKWVEARGGHPARVKKTGRGKDPGILRIDYPGYSGAGTLERIDWDEWFDWFDRDELAFLYQNKRDSRFSKLVRR